MIKLGTCTLVAGFNSAVVGNKQVKASYFLSTSLKSIAMLSFKTDLNLVSLYEQILQQASQLEYVQSKQALYN
jgi:hypothetical protein